MRLEALIADLLFEHDCVVVPGFGGLVANYRSARLNRHSHIIFPPSKHVGFNYNLKNNDGLLANHLAAVLHLSYKEAQAYIEENVAAWQKALRSDGRIFWEKIGTFFYDKAGQIQFVPEEQENFLLSSYGLLPVQLSLVPKEETITGETPVVPIHKSRSKSSVAWRVAAVLTIPILMAGIWVAGSRIKADDFNFASLNPFEQSKVSAAYTPLKLSSVESFEQQAAGGSPLDKILADSIREEEVRYDFVHQSFSEDGIAIAGNIPAVADKTHKAITNKGVAKGSTVSGKYAVIGGAFLEEDNATNFLKKLKADGFDAHYAGRKGNLQLVAYGFYDTKEEAQKALANIRSSGTGQGWIKRY